MRSPSKDFSGSPLNRAQYQNHQLSVPDLESTNKRRASMSDAHVNEEIDEDLIHSMAEDLNIESIPESIEYDSFDSYTASQVEDLETAITDFQTRNRGHSDSGDIEKIEGELATELLKSLVDEEGEGKEVAQVVDKYVEKLSSMPKELRLKRTGSFYQAVGLIDKVENHVGTLRRKNTLRKLELES